MTFQKAFKELTSIADTARLGQYRCDLERLASRNKDGEIEFSYHFWLLRDKDTMWECDSLRGLVSKVRNALLPSLDPVGLA